MKQTYDTPQVRSAPAKQTELTGPELYWKLVEERENYREDASKGYCKYNPEADAKLKSKIADALASLGGVIPPFRHHKIG